MQQYKLSENVIAAQWSLLLLSVVLSFSPLGYGAHHTLYTYNRSRPLSFFEHTQAFEKAVEHGDLRSVDCVRICWPRIINAGYMNYGLLLAAGRGHAHIVHYLHAHGADIHAQDRAGETALHVAAQGGFIDVIGYLMTRGADVNALGVKSSRSPLHAAVCKGHVDAVKRLVRYGADIDRVDDRKNQLTAYYGVRKGESSLSIAFVYWKVVSDSRRMKCIVQYLIQQGATVSDVDKDWLDSCWWSSDIKTDREVLGKALLEISIAGGLPKDLIQLILSFLSVHLRVPQRVQQSCCDKLLSKLRAFVSSK